MTHYVDEQTQAAQEKMDDEALRMNCLSEAIKCNCLNPGHKQALDAAKMFYDWVSGKDQQDAI